MSASMSWDDGLQRRIEDAAFRGVIRGTNRVRNEIIRLIMRTSKSGRVYRRRGVTHRASAPGEPPANWTGNHMRHITTRFERPTLSGFVNASSAYARPLEFGSSKMEPRPHMRRGLTNVQRQVQNDIASEIQTEINRG